MFFTRIALVLCATGIVAAFLADLALFAAAHFYGGVGILLSPHKWFWFGLLAWSVVFLVGWQFIRVFGVFPLR